MSKREELKKRREKAARQQQLIVIGIITIAALLVVGLMVYPNLQRAQMSGTPAGTITPIATEVYPQVDGKALGPKEASVVITVFSDFQCPFCRQFSQTTEKQVIDTYIANGQGVRLEYKHFIVVDGNVGGSESRRAAEASECASEQGQFWNFHEITYANWNGEGEGAFRDSRLKAFAESIGLEMNSFNSCFDSGKYADAVANDAAYGRVLGVNSTPTVLINGQRIANPLNFAEFQSAIAAELGK